MNKKLLIVGISSVLVASLIFIIASSIGPNSPGVAANDNSIGSVSWSQTSFIKVQDGNTAGIDIFPPGGGNHARDYLVRLVKNGNIVGDSLSRYESLPTTLSNVYYGGNSSLWGETWAVADINNVNFGVVYSVAGVTPIGDFISNYLKATNFGFNIPIGSTIDGIEVKVICIQWLGSGNVEVDVIQMTVYFTPPEFPSGDVTNDASFGTVYWVDPANAKISDNSYSTATDSSGTDPYTVYLKVTNFGFNIPTTATILGIEVRIEKSCDYQAEARHTEDSRVRLVDEYGVIGTTDRSLGEYWPVSDTNFSHGGPTDLWGDNWIPGYINDVDFGFVISAQLVNNGGEIVAKIDYVTMIIYYELCACPGLNNNWEVNMIYNCVLSTNCDLGTGNLTFINTGSFTANSSLQLKNMQNPIQNQIVYIGSSANVVIG